MPFCIFFFFWRLFLDVSKLMLYSEHEMISDFQVVVVTMVTFNLYGWERRYRDLSYVGEYIYIYIYTSFLNQCNKFFMVRCL